MDSNDVKQEETQSKDNKSDKGRQNILLMILLAMAGGFAYLYFFTDVIRPQTENKPAEAPVAQVVKKPLPPRDGAAGGSEVKPAAGEQKPAETAAKNEPPKVEPAKAAPAAVAPAAVQPPKPKEEPKKAEPVKVTEKKAAAPVAEAKDQKKTATEKKNVADTRKVAAKSPSKAAATASSGNWTVVVGSYVLESSLATDQAKVKKAGLEPVIKTGPRKKSMMNRLLLAEYADRSAAKAELEKLRRYTSDAFILDHGSRHYVYAGSYLLDSRAASEKERLVSAGFSLTLKREEVSIPSKSLTAGVFADKKAAEAAVKKLKDAGIKATLKQ